MNLKVPGVEGNLIRCRDPVRRRRRSQMAALSARPANPAWDTSVKQNRVHQIRPALWCTGRHGAGDPVLAGGEHLLDQIPPTSCRRSLLIKDPGSYCSSVGSASVGSILGRSAGSTGGGAGSTLDVSVRAEDPFSSLAIIVDPFPW